MTKKEVNILSKAIRAQFGGVVEAEPVNDKGRYRFAVKSPKFEKMRPLQRQDALWEIVDEVLPRESTIDISLILAYAPSELTLSK